MTDVFSREKRSAIMALIKGKNTSPEKALKKFLRANHIRYRSHVKNLPGTPDIVLPDHKTVIFVNGCFWHGHTGCRRSTLPTTNVAFWKKKIEGNKRRDRRKTAQLRKLGWKVKTFWQCTKDMTGFLKYFPKSSPILFFPASMD